MALTRWIAPLPNNASQADPADLVRFQTFFQQLPSDAAAREYVNVHLARLARTITLVPKPAGAGRALEQGSYMQMAPALHALCGYPEVCGADFGPLIEQLLTERIEGRDRAAWVHELLERNHLDTSLRGEQTYCVASVNPDLPVKRYPAWLYD